MMSGGGSGTRRGLHHRLAETATAAGSSTASRPLSTGASAATRLAATPARRTPGHCAQLQAVPFPRRITDPAEPGAAARTGLRTEVADTSDKAPAGYRAADRRSAMRGAGTRGPGPRPLASGGVHIAAAVLGALIVAAIWVNVAVTLIIPRGRVGFIKIVDRFVDSFYSAAVRLVRSWDRRDALLASQPVVALGALLLAWLGGFIVGYGLLLWLPGGSFPAALREAGSSLFTLGFAARAGAEPSVVDFLAAASGLVIVAVLIVYLPTLYAANNRRETEVTLLSPRAGIPAWGPGARHRAAGAHLRFLGALVR
jgi:hypothetical protein